MLEHEFHQILLDLRTHGFRFDVEAAHTLEAQLTQVMRDIQVELDSLIPPRVETMKTPQHYTITFAEEVCDRVFQWGDTDCYTLPTKGECEALRKQINKELRLSRKEAIKPAHVVIAPGPLKTKTHAFNPGSSKQVREYLHEKHGFLSPTLTDTGQAKLKAGEATQDELAKEYGQITEDVLNAAPFPVCKQFARYMMTQKRLSMLATGQQAWLKQVTSCGRIHHREVSSGCATGRCIHASPNLGQVPSISVDKEGNHLTGIEGRFGHECRALFLPDEGEVLVGADLSGIEARMLSHYLHPYDGGAYGDIILNGDIHQVNADSISRSLGVTLSRKDSKPGLYSWLYGAGDYKMGLVACAGTESPDVQRLYSSIYNSLRAKGEGAAKASKSAYIVLGRKMRQGLETSVDGLSEFIDNVKKKAREQGYLTPLDRRVLPVRSEHAALNTLLQGSSAIILKRWAVRTQATVVREGIKAKILATVHDELQATVGKDDVQHYSRVVVDQVRLTGEYYGLNIPLSGEAKAGESWAKTH